MVYVELWFDAEADREWKVTLWKIPSYDFDPLTADYITLDLGTEHQHLARQIQLEIVRDLKRKNAIVVANAYMDRSRFQIRPRWFEELLSPLEEFEKERKHSHIDSHTVLSKIKNTYTIWFDNTMSGEIYNGYIETSR